MDDKEKEIKELIKCIKDIDEQLNFYNRDKTINVLLEAKNHLYVESFIYENEHGPTTNINYLNDYILQSKLVPYKNMCIDKLNYLLGKEELDKIINKEN